MSDRPSVPYRFDPDATAAGLKQQYGGLEPGVETGDRVVVAGRLMLRRGQGKLAFGLGWWLVHAVMLAVLLALFAQRLAPYWRFRLR